MSAQMITDSTHDPVIRSCLQKVVPGSKARAAKQAWHTGQAPVAVIHGVKGSNIPAQQQARIFCYYCAADAQPVDLSPAAPGVDQPGPAVPIAEVPRQKRPRLTKLPQRLMLRRSPCAIMLHHPGHHESLGTAAAAVSG